MANRSIYHRAKGDKEVPDEESDSDTDAGVACKAENGLNGVGKDTCELSLKERRDRRRKIHDCDDTFEQVDDIRFPMCAVGWATEKAATLSSRKIPIHSIAHLA